MPKDIHVPVICVGPGTGIAPARAIIEQRTLQGSNGMSRLNLMSLSDVEVV